MSGEFEQKPRQPVIREATLNDMDKIRPMQAQSWRDTYPNPENGVSREWVVQRTTDWLTPEKMAESRDLFAKTLVDPNQFYRVAELNDEIVGFIHGVIREDGSGHLWGLYTEKSQHGTGLGSDLINQLDAFFDQRGIREIDLEVAAYNKRAIRFYGKHGFAKVPGSEHFFAEIMPCINMKREVQK